MPEAMPGKFLVLLALENGGCSIYWIDRAMCERAERIGKTRRMLPMTAQEYARLLAITHAKAEGLELSKKTRELQ
jgi:hypothetical protein